MRSIKEYLEESLNENNKNSFFLVKNKKSGKEQKIRADTDFEVVEKMIKRPPNKNDIEFFKSNYSYKKILDECIKGDAMKPGKMKSKDEKKNRVKDIFKKIKDEKAKEEKE